MWAGKIKYATVLCHRLIEFGITSRHIEASLAKKIAMGDVDPITLLPMQDINPGFMLHASIKKKELPFISYNQSENGKGKALNEPRSDGILMFFGGSSFPSPNCWF